MFYFVSHHKGPVCVSIKLPASKSVANRVLLIRALCGHPFSIDNIPDSDDTKVLQQALNDYVNQQIIDVGHAGTSMRFLTAFLCIQSGKEYLLTGSERMKNRPIAKLVEALKSLGADIQYQEKEGYPPLKIKGKKITGGTVSIDGGVSSQYISALLMIAPVFPEGLELILQNQVISASYIRMTLSIMQYFGVKTEWKGNRIIIQPQTYKSKDFIVEPDWSAASYWYQIAALAKKPDIFLAGLKKDSFQGDVKVAELFRRLGVQTDFLADGVRLTKNGDCEEYFSFDFIENPDLVQTLAVTLCQLNIPFSFEGTQSLKIKETDRIEALRKELLKTGKVIESPFPERIQWKGTAIEQKDTPLIQTYNDHRMAMCFAPLALCMKKILIEDPGVVAKSYPSFWEDLQLAGFQVIENE